MENLFHLLFGKYFGIDWLALLFMYLQTDLLGKKNRFGFIAGAISNVCWIIFGFIALSVADPLANFIIFFLNVRGFMRWRNAQPTYDAMHEKGGLCEHCHLALSQ